MDRQLGVSIEQSKSDIECSVGHIKGSFIQMCTIGQRGHFTSNWIPDSDIETSNTKLAEMGDEVI